MTTASASIFRRGCEHFPAILFKSQRLIAPTRNSIKIVRLRAYTGRTFVGLQVERLNGLLGAAVQAEDRNVGRMYRIVRSMGDCM